KPTKQAVHSKDVLDQAPALGSLPLLQAGAFHFLPGTFYEIVASRSSLDSLKLRMPGEIRPRRLARFSPVPICDVRYRHIYRTAGPQGNLPFGEVVCV
ncbi:MAG: hypothetical protein ACYSWQ_05725, partial [Planctomycetota bacterium]